MNIIKCLLAVCLLTLLGACGDIDIPEPEPAPEPAPAPNEDVAAFENQDIMWESCDPSIFEDDEQLAEFGGVEDLLSLLEGRLECAVIKTPLDWNNPKLDTVELDILRVKAQQERTGAVFLNPGGPGVDGLTLGALFGVVFSTGGARDDGATAADLFEGVSQSYDILSFSPRGTGQSFQFTCEGEPLTLNQNFKDRSAENLDILLSEARKLAEACKNNPASEYINTE